MKKNDILIRVRILFRHVVQSLPLSNCKYAIPQKINPQNESKREDIKAIIKPMSSGEYSAGLKLESGFTGGKKGMTPAMMKAKTQTP